MAIFRKNSILPWTLVFIVLLAAIYFVKPDQPQQQHTDTGIDALSGQGGPDAADDSGAAEQPANPSAGQPLTLEDMSIGGIQIGDSIETVQKLYGKPSEKTIVHGIGDPMWIYKNEGLEVSFGGPIWQVRATKEAVGSTPRGIHVNSSRQDVLDAYPDAETDSFGDRVNLVQFSPDRKYSIYFGIENDKVASIALIQDLVIGTVHDKNKQ